MGTTPKQIVLDTAADHVRDEATLADAGLVAQDKAVALLDVVKPERERIDLPGRGSIFLAPSAHNQGLCPRSHRQDRSASRRSGASAGYRLSVIDERLDPEDRPSKEGRYRFTHAHEGGGHWRLHRRRYQCQLCVGAHPTLCIGYRVHPHMLRHACGFALAKGGRMRRAAPLEPLGSSKTALHRHISPAKSRGTCPRRA
jgi:hypothetical protein